MSPAFLERFRIAVLQLQRILEEAIYMDPWLAGFGARYSTETMLVTPVDDL